MKEEKKREDMCYLLEVLVLELLSTGLFWEGVQCDNPLYKLYVQPVTVQKGLCVFIPCNFTYDPANASSTSKLYGYWYKGRCLSSPPLVATNDPGQTIAENAQNRFFLSEEVGEGNCSLVINDAQNNDGGNYCFKIENESKPKYSFADELEVTVRELQNPAINFSGNLRANHRKNITCTAPKSCSLKSPRIFLKVKTRNFTPKTSELQSNETHVYTIFDFTPLAADDKEKLSCTVSYGTENSSIKKTKPVTLKVKYPPQKVYFSIESNTSQTIVTDTTQIVVEKDKSVTLQCKGDGNPSSKAVWLNKSKSMQKDKLKFANVQIPDMGTYKCQIKNSEGVAYASLQLTIREAQSEDLSSFVPLLHVLCLKKVLLCFFFFFAIISFFTQRKAQVRRRVTIDIKKMQPAMAPEEKEMNKNSGSSTSV